MGGLDWAGFDRVADLLGITNTDQLMERLLVIKQYRPDRPTAPDAPEKLMEDT